LILDVSQKVPEQVVTFGYITTANHKLASVLFLWYFYG